MNRTSRETELPDIIAQFDEIVATLRKHAFGKPRRDLDWAIRESQNAISDLKMYSLSKNTKYGSNEKMDNQAIASELVDMAERIADRKIRKVAKIYHDDMWQDKDELSNFISKLMDLSGDRYVDAIFNDGRERVEIDVELVDWSDNYRDPFKVDYKIYVEPTSDEIVLVKDGRILGKANYDLHDPDGIDPREVYKVMEKLERKKAPKLIAPQDDTPSIDYGDSQGYGS